MKFFLFIQCLFFLGGVTPISAAERIPHVFHVIRADETPFSEDEIQTLQFWKSLNPHWSFELWSPSLSLVDPLPKMKRHLIDSEHFPWIWDRLRMEDDLGTKLELLSCEILFSRGGVWFDPRLCACKSLNAVIQDRSLIVYSKDRKGFSFLSASAKHPALGHFLQSLSSPGAPALPSLFDSVEKTQSQMSLFLSERFVLPEGVFTPLAPRSDLDGVCFWNFASEGRISQMQHKAIRSQIAQESFTKKMVRLAAKMKHRVVWLSLLFFLNGAFFCLYFRRFPKNTSIVLLGFGMLLVCCFIFLGREKKFFSLYSTSKMSAFHQLCCLNPLFSCSAKDRVLLKMYEDLYDKHFPKQQEPPQVSSIPLTAHVIWLGDKPFPSESLPNLLSWKRHHPHWTFKFWTDRSDRAAPFEWMEKHLLGEAACPHVGDLIPRSNNFAEQSDLLRYEILFQEGGLYLDHDVECLRCMDGLMAHLDFFASLELLHASETAGVNCVVTNCLVGSIPFHPLLKETMKRVRQRRSFLTTINAPRCFVC